MSNDTPQPNPQNHDKVDDAGVDKPSQAEGSEDQVDGSAAPTGGSD
jgi:hypothetical protein